MTRLQIELIAAVAITGALALLWRRVVALAAAIVFVSNLPQQHRENIAAIAKLTAAVQELTGRFDRLTADLEQRRDR